MKWRAFLKVSSTSPFSSRRVRPPAWSQCRCVVTTASTSSGVMPRRRKACSMPSGSRSATCRARFSLSLLPIPVSQTMTRPFLRAIRQTHAQSIMLLPSGGFCFSHRTLGTTPNIRPPSAFQWSVTRRWSSRSPSCTAPYMLREMAVAAISTSQLTKDYGAGRGLFDLGLHRRFREYSSGNKQKLGILLAFMHRPELLILDEPTSGLDPLNQQEFYELLRETRAGGATIFLSSHVLSEVEHVCDRVGILRAGRLVKVAELGELTRIRVHHVEVEFAPGEEVPAERLRSADGVEDVTVEGQRLRCTVHGNFDALLQAVSGSRVIDLVSTEPSLEEFFLSFFGEPKPKALPS